MFAIQAHFRRKKERTSCSLTKASTAAEHRSLKTKQRPMGWQTAAIAISLTFDFDKDGDLDMLLLNHNPKNLPILNIEATAQQFKQDNPEKRVEAV